MTVLVTGGAGFIGYHLAAALLARGEQVVAIDSLNDYYAPQLKRDRVADLVARYGDRFDFITCDFADHAALDAALATRSFNAIAHLGAQPGVRYSLLNPRAYIQSNLVGHLNLLEVARARVIPMVYASSSSVYGNARSLPLHVEDRVDHPVSLYAATKKADELISESYAHLYRLQLTGLRFFTVYGPWGRPDMAPWLFTRAILAGEPIKIFNHGKMRRDFTYVDDIVAGVIACLDTPPLDDGLVKPGGSSAPHRLYNIGNHRSENLLDFIALIEQACGRSAIREWLPMQPGDVTDTFADITPIATELGYAPTTTIAQGIPRFVDWFRHYHGV